MGFNSGFKGLKFFVYFLSLLPACYIFGLSHISWFLHSCNTWLSSLSPRNFPRSLYFLFFGPRTLFTALFPNIITKLPSHTLCMFQREKNHVIFVIICSFKWENVRASELQPCTLKDIWFTAHDLLVEQYRIWISVSFRFLTPFICDI